MGKTELHMAEFHVEVWWLEGSQNQHSFSLEVDKDCCGSQQKWTLEITKWLNGKINWHLHIKLLNCTSNCWSIFDVMAKEIVFTSLALIVSKPTYVS